jgi:hypothetical protein
VMPAGGPRPSPKPSRAQGRTASKPGEEGERGRRGRQGLSRPGTPFAGCEGAPEPALLHQCFRDASTNLQSKSRACLAVWGSNASDLSLPSETKDGPINCGQASLGVTRSGTAMRRRMSPRVMSTSACRAPAASSA